MTTNGYPPPQNQWGEGNDDPTTQFAPVGPYEQSSYADPNNQGYYEPQPPKPPRNPMLPVLIAVTVMVLVVVASAAGFAYYTMNSGPSPLENATSEATTAATTENESSSESSSAGESTSDKATSSSETSTSATTSATPGAPPGERPADPDLPEDAQPVNNPALSGSDAGYLVNLYKAGSTSDEFANAVHQAYLFQYSSPPTGKHTVTAKSPVTGKTYEMTCTDTGSYVHCTGGVGAHVYIA